MLVYHSRSVLQWFHGPAVHKPLGWHCGTDSGVNTRQGGDKKWGYRLSNSPSSQATPQGHTHLLVLFCFSFFLHKINYMCAFLHVIPCRGQKFTCRSKLPQLLLCFKLKMLNQAPCLSTCSWIPCTVCRGFCPILEIPGRQKGSCQSKAGDH